MLNKINTSLRIILIVALVLISSFLTIIFYSFPFIKQTYFHKEVKKIYFAENITSAHKYLIDEFNKLHQDEIKVIPINLPYEKFSTNKRKELITKNLRNSTSRVDIYAIDIVWNERFKKWAEPLNKYFPNFNELDIVEQSKYYCYSDSTLYSIPFFIDVGVLYYRDDLIKKSKNYNTIVKQLQKGITWQQIINAKIPKTKFKYLFQADSYEGLMCNLLEFSGQNPIISENHLLNFSKELEKNLNKIKSFIYEYKIVPTEVTKFDESKSFNFALENDIPFFRGWPTGKQNIQVSLKNREKIKYLKFAPLPRFENRNSVSSIGGWNLIISKNSIYKNESIKFIKFLISKNSQKYLWEKSGYIPILNSIYNEKDFIIENEELVLFKNLMKNGVYRIKHEHYTRISDIITKNLNLYFQNRSSFRESKINSLDEINNSIKLNLSKNK